MKAYDLLTSGLNRRSKSIQVPVTDEKTIFRIYAMVHAENPIFFDSRNYSYCVGRDESTIMPDYKMDESEYKQTARKCIDRISASIRGFINQDEYMKGRLAHDLVCDHMKYHEIDKEWDQTIISPLINNGGVCAGFAMVYKMICDMLNLRSIYVTGLAGHNEIQNSMNPHAWNQVLISGKWYNVDVTFDLCLKKYSTRYDYLYLSDSEISRDHKNCTSPFPCNDPNLSYYNHYGMHIHNYDELCKHFKRMSAAKCKTFTFKICSEIWKPTADEIMNTCLRESNMKSINMVSNFEQGVYTIHKM